ncbi:leucine-rich repeat domain-containing protein [Fimbriiglobus ruber]|uniref:leucine-rich repeat domain-containing protein n=1 Tax=Fimbriiglobus ruber TaxID=1908690 RepID=UPI000B4A87A4|nr:hypothetical protein [Fimbriiglobus ruber]
MSALLLLLAGSTAITAPVPRVPETQVSEKVIRAWNDAGAEVRWVAISGLWDDKPTPGCRVGFRFHGWVEGRSDDLPAPDAPFYLDVSFPWPGDESKGIAKEITDGGLKELVKFQNLQSLDVFGRNITDVGAKEITRLKNLERLDLSCAKVTAVGLKELAKLQSITRLSLSQMDVTEEMLKEVAEFKNLTRFGLSFNESEVTIAGMKHIAKLEKLEKLDFFNVNVSDAGARKLGPLKNLKDLDFLNTKVTKAGAEELHKLLPKCDVSVRTVSLEFPPLPILENGR